MIILIAHFYHYSSTNWYTFRQGLYAKCPKSDKSKISKGIVAAVREMGGSFLELDEATGIYHDIGDKKACEKTSQALREGQTKVRQKLRSGKGHIYDISLLASHRPGTAIPAEGYFGYSIQVLESLYKKEEVSTESEPGMSHAVSM